QSPMHAPPPQLHHSHSSGSMHGPPIQYQTMGQVNPAPAYPGMGRTLYQPSPTQQYNVMHQSAAGQQAGMQGWAQSPPQGQGQQQQQQQQQQQGWQGF
ncbi:hypothetical protein H2199_001564, partial [Coniosporium tulheliwenetii]